MHVFVRCRKSLTQWSVVLVSTERARPLPLIIIIDPIPKLCVVFSNPFDLVFFMPAVALIVAVAVLPT